MKHLSESVLLPIVLQNSKKWLAAFFSAKRGTKRKSPINMSSSALPKLPVDHHLLLWSPARLFDRRAHSSENLSPVIQKEFSNTICHKPTWLT